MSETEEKQLTQPACQCCVKLTPLIECLTKTSEELDYKYYLERRSYLDSVNSEQQASLDNKILALSGTFLAFSTFFIDKIVPLSNAAFLWVLFCSWGTLLVSALATLLSFKFSALIASEQIPRLDECYSENANQRTIYDDIPTQYDKLLTINNFLGFWLFFVGILFLVSFIAINADHIGPQTNSSKAQLVGTKEYPQRGSHDPK